MAIAAWPPYPSGMDVPGVETRVRAICLALPEVTEKLSHGAPGFFVGKQFVMLWPDGHHDHQFRTCGVRHPQESRRGL
jgi:hypothetical protein